MRDGKDVPAAGWKGRCLTKTLPVEGENLVKVTAALRRAPLFSGLTAEQLQQTAVGTHLLLLQAGEELARQGEPQDGFFLVLAGELAVHASPAAGGDPLDVARFKAGQTVGLTGALLGKPASATLTATGQSTVLRLENRLLEETSRHVPSFGLEVAKVLAERLTRAVERVALPDADPDLAPDPKLLELLPAEFMERHRLVPLTVEGQVLTVGAVDDPTPEVVQRLRTNLPAMELRMVRLPASRFTELLSTRAGKPPAAPTASQSHDPALLDRLLRAMVTEGASDLHLSGGQRPGWRIDGEMRTIADLTPLGPDAVLGMLEKAIPAGRREEFAATSDTDFAHEIAGVSRFRVNLFRDCGGIGAVLRRIPSAIVALEQLGMPPVVTSLCTAPKGLVLVTGPTGSGKSTTLAAMVDKINASRQSHILTLEDPVEFLHPSKKSFVNQREVGSHTGSFARALKAALREDPDVVLVGEMRDLETVALALEVANTGHLVLATLHTSTAISTIDRIVGMFPADQQNRVQATLADVLRGVVSQNLLKRKGGGRVAAVEILVVNHAVSNLIREGKPQMLVSVMQTGKAAGNQLLNESLAKLVTEGKVEFEEAQSKAVDKADLARRLNRPAVTE